MLCISSEASYADDGDARVRVRMDSNVVNSCLVRSVITLVRIILNECFFDSVD